MFREVEDGDVEFRVGERLPEGDQVFFALVAILESPVAERIAFPEIAAVFPRWQGVLKRGPHAIVGAVVVECNGPNAVLIRQRAETAGAACGPV